MMYIARTGESAPTICVTLRPTLSDRRSGSIPHSAAYIARTARSSTR